MLVTRDGAPVEDVTVIWFTTEGCVSPAEAYRHRRPGSDHMDHHGPVRRAVRLRPGSKAVRRSAYGDRHPDPDAPNTVLVRSEGGNRFEPTEFTVPAGETENWLWSPGSTGHNIVPDDGGVAALRRAGGLAQVAGVHLYQARRLPLPLLGHGAAGGVGMSGTIIVTELGEQ